MKSKTEKAKISTKFELAVKRAVDRGFLVSEQTENGQSALHVFNAGNCVLITRMDSNGVAFSCYYDAKGVCVRTLTVSPLGAVEQIGRVY